jgi:hypothetical protein
VASKLFILSRPTYDRLLVAEDQVITPTGD